MIAHLFGATLALAVWNATCLGFAPKPRCEGRPKPGSPGRVSTSKRPTRRVEPERPRLRRTGLSAAPKAGEPAHAVLNTAAWQGERRPPSNPQLPAPLDPTTEPVVAALVAKRHPPPPRPTLGTMRTHHAAGLGDMVSVAGGVGSRVAASRREPCDSPWTSAGSADLSGIEGAESLASPCRGRAKRGPKG